ncbi:hypothetical protein FKM82_018137 [Ascaphus truei]
MTPVMFHVILARMNLRGSFIGLIPISIYLLVLISTLFIGLFNYTLMLYHLKDSSPLDSYMASYIFYVTNDVLYLQSSKLL